MRESTRTGHARQPSSRPCVQNLEEALIKSGLALTSELSLPVILQRIVDLARDMTCARYGALGITDEAGAVESLVTSGATPGRRHPSTFRFPTRSDSSRSFLSAPVTAGQRLFGRIYLTGKSGAGGFSQDDEQALAILASQAGVAIANSRLHDEAQNQRRWLEALRGITSAILGGAGVHQLLEMVAESARELVSSDFANVVTPSGLGGELVISVATGPLASELVGQVLPWDHSITAEVIRKGEPLVLDNASADPRAVPSIARLGVGPLIFVPLRKAGRSFGAVTTGNLVGGPRFNPGALRRVEAFADQASIAIEYARAQRELERLAVMEERERIARELHDGIIQSLFAVGMHLEAAAGMSESAVGERLQHVVDQIDGAIFDLRNYIFGLRPGILADHELGQAIEDLAADLATQASLDVELDIDATLASDLRSRSADVVQLVREALSNVQRHASASWCRIELARTDCGVKLAVLDDGKGFDPSGVGSGAGCQGLLNMQDRVHNLGGTMDISATPGRGTMLRFALPVSGQHLAAATPA